MHTTLATRFITAALWTSLAAVVATALATTLAAGRFWSPAVLANAIAAAAAASIVSLRLYGILARLVLAPLEPLLRTPPAAYDAGQSLPGPVPAERIPDTEIGDVLRAWNRLRARVADAPARLSLEALMNVLSRGLRPGSASAVGPLVDELLNATILIAQAGAAALWFVGTDHLFAPLGTRRAAQQSVPADDPIMRALETPPAGLAERTGPVIIADTGCRGAAGLAHLPLRIEGRVIGVLSLARRTPFGPRDQDVLAVLAGYLSLSLEHLQLSRRVFEQATRDTLTSVWTRRYVVNYLRRELTRAQETHTALSILMVDLDGFKVVNDRHGHAVGDAVLACAAAALTRTSRQGTFVGRYGGDEFLIVLPRTAHTTARDIGWRLRDAVAKALRDPRGGLPVGLRVTPSVGVATAPEHGVTPEDLTASADAALYAAKQRGRNRVESAERVVAALAATGLFAYSPRL